MVYSTMMSLELFIVWWQDKISE